MACHIVSVNINKHITENEYAYLTDFLKDRFFNCHFKIMGSFQLKHCHGQNMAKTPLHRLLKLEAAMINMRAAYQLAVVRHCIKTVLVALFKTSLLIPDLQHNLQSD